MEAHKELAQSMGGDRVIFTGYRTDVADFYKMADVFLFPSFREGLPVAVMEAMAAGLPCIVSRIRGNVDLLRSSRYLFEPTDENMLYQLLNDAANGVQIEQECERNWETQKKYDIKNVSKEMQGIYSAAIEGTTTNESLRKTFVDQHISKTFADAFIWEKKILQNCDAYFYMHSRKGDYELSRYDPYRSKLRESDMPRFKVRDIDKIPRYDFGEDGEHWVYAGSIGGPHYNPNQLLEIFKKIENSPKRVLHLYTRGAEADRIAAMANKEKLNVRVHGYVDAATLESIMATADVIVSLKTSGQISAKIFECMSYGKPIVHFSGQKNDPDVYYLEKYILGNIVKMYEENQESELNKLVQFLENSAGKQVDPTELKKTFETSTPEYSAERIAEEIMRVKNA